MSEELSIATVSHPAGKKLDWKAGFELIQTMDADDLAGSLLYGMGSVSPDEEKIRKEATDLFTNLRNILTDKGDANVVVVDYPGAPGTLGVTAYIAGGTSFNGEDPSGAYTVIDKALYFPEVLEAIGLD